MIFFLLFCILCWAFFRYESGSPYIFCPEIIVLGVFGLSISVACINCHIWGDISLLTYEIIILSLVFFSLGCMLAPLKGKQISVFFPQINIPWIYNVIVILYMLLVTFLDYNDVSTMAGESNLGVFAVIALARENMYIQDVSIEHSLFVLQGLYASKALFYIYVYYIFYQKIINRCKVSLLCWIPIILYFIQCLLSTGRTDLIYMVYAIMFLVYFNLKSRRGWIKRNEVKYIKYIAVVFSLFILLFLFLSLNRHEGENIDLNQTFGVYVGSPIYAYDWYLNKYGVDGNAEYFGQYTQWLYYQVANALHWSNHTCESVLPPVYLSGIMTNIYTCLYRYTHDYGIYVMFMILSLLGFAYTKFFYYIRNNPTNGIMVIFYTFLSYPLVEFAIEERFFSVLLSARTFYCCIYILLFYKILLNKHIFYSKN